MMQSSAAFFAAAIFLPSAATAPGIVINGEPERRALFGSLPTTSPPGECGLPEYTGATSTIMDCRNTYGTDSWYCPEDFPMFPTSSETSPNCELAVVGAGAGGLYSAMRLIDTGKMQGSDICIFEMTNRVAGRLYSLRGLGPNRDLSVDAGGYRTWCGRYAFDASVLRCILGGAFLAFDCVGTAASLLICSVCVASLPLRQAAVHTSSSRTHHRVPEHSHGML
eukprot:6178566-Pleurochrysis_carterae.AAC.5